MSDTAPSRAASAYTGHDEDLFDEPTPGELHDEEGLAIDEEGYLESLAAHRDAHDLDDDDELEDEGLDADEDLTSDDADEDDEFDLEAAFDPDTFIEEDEDVYDDDELDAPALPLGADGQPVFRSGFVALVGRPNAGKSTLINAIIGEKLLITSPTAQTTRNRISAIYNAPGMQMVLVDTPGLHKPVDALGEELNISALNALKDVDVVAMMVDGSAPAGRGDEWVAQHVATSNAFKVLVISKADLVEQDKARLQLDRMEKFCHFDDVIVLSAKENFNVDAFVSLVARHLPEGPQWFPEDMQTDQPIEVMIAEMIREKVLLNTRDEVPHSVGVMVDSTSYDEKANVSKIYATVYVERDGQRGIIVGAGGSMIKRIGTSARHDLERLLGNKVFLKLNVKVKQNWRTDASQIRRFGYGEGA